MSQVSFRYQKYSVTDSRDDNMSDSHREVDLPVSQSSESSVVTGDIDEQHELSQKSTTDHVVIPVLRR